MSRSTSQTSSTTTTTTNDVSRSLSVKTNIKPTLKAANPLPPSDINLFLTNLRLLDLDLKPDWPKITIQTFSSKNADQKQRIDGVEWTLFRLFEIWDPEETAQKLNPFFPPLEPLQSRNLRAALFRSLNELKKNGVLGRESVLRKTMLDECKGEKFHELLALFSNVVLKKVLASRERNKPNMTVARKLATATMLSNDKQQSLLPLSIAHKAALVNVLRRKEEKRRRFAEFEGMLATKGEEINRRIMKSKGTPRAKKTATSQKEAEAIKKQLKDNWIGNQKWLEVILHGDDVQAEDVFLNSSFNTVWRMIERGFRLQDAASEAGLLENLQARVHEQQARLEKWKQFHEKLQVSGSESSQPASKAPKAIIEFKFEDHLQLQLNSIKEGDDRLPRKPSLRREYQDIISDMDEDLLRAAKARYNRSSVPQLRRRTSSHSNPTSPARRRKMSRSGSTPQVPTSPGKTSKAALRKVSQEQTQVPIPQRRAPPAQTQTPLDSEATLVGLPSTRPHTAASAPNFTDSSVQHQRYHEEESSDPLPAVSSPPAPNTVQTERHSPTPETTFSYPSEPPIPILEPPQLTQEEVMAERIISSIGNATPSPVKKPQPRLSLMERTRLSMAQHSNFEPVPESPSLPSPPIPEPSTVEEDADRRATLLERTRLSMAAMSAKPRASLAPKDKRKSSRRESLFPVNQFDTPRNRKSFERIEEARSSAHTPKDELFNDDADYERIFKSRPRIATSPVFSPGQEQIIEGDEDEDFDEGVTGVDLADVDADDDEDGFTRTWENSPSRRPAGRMKY